MGMGMSFMGIGDGMEMGLGWQNFCGMGLMSMTMSLFIVYASKAQTSCGS